MIPVSGKEKGRTGVGKCKLGTISTGKGEEGECSGIMYVHRQLALDPLERH